MNVRMHPVVVFKPCQNGFERAVPFEGLHARDCSVRDGKLTRVIDGEVRFETPVGEPAVSLHFGKQRIYVRTDRALHAFDDRDGARKGTYPLGPRDSVDFSDDGACCASAGTVSFLDRDLRLRAAHPNDLGQSTVQALGDGRVLLQASGWPSRAQILLQDGRKPLDAKVEPYSVRTDAGRVTLVSRNGATTRDEEPQILRYDPRTDTTETMTGTQASQAVLPLRDGRYVIVHKYIDTPRLILFDASGAQRRHFLLGDGERRAHVIERFMLAPDEQSAYVQVRRTEFDHSERRGLYRLDLREAGVDKDPGQLMYEHAAPFVPVVLRDGRVLAFRDGEVDLIEADGTPGGATTAEALRLAGSPALEPLKLGTHGTEEPPLAEALSRFSYAWPIAMPDDGTFERQPVAMDEALHVLGFQDEASWQAAQAPAQMLDRTFREAHSLPLPSGFQGSVTASAASIEARFDGRVVQLPCPRPGQFVSALVLASPAAGAWIAAGASDGAFYAYDLRDEDPASHPVRVDAGEAVCAIQPAPHRPGTIRALTAGGTSLLVDLDTQPLHGPPPPPDAPGIVLEPSVVRIGGIALPRRS